MTSMLSRRSRCGAVREFIFLKPAAFLGWETLPDDIAESVREFYTFEIEKNERSQDFTDMTKRRNTYLAAWNWNVFGNSDNQASYTTHTMMATQETAEYYWQRYCYTKDLTGCATMLMTLLRGRPSSIALIPALLKRMMENIIFITPICTSTFGRAKTY